MSDDIKNTNNKIKNANSNLTDNIPTVLFKDQHFRSTLVFLELGKFSRIWESGVGVISINHPQSQYSNVSVDVFFSFFIYLT